MTQQDLMIEIKDMNKWYVEFHVLKNINLSVKKGEKIVICGPSGSGKSTMIRCINRLEEHQKGQIIVSGNEITEDLKNIEAVRRDVGMCFQHFNLFPHLTILENCTLAPIWVKKMPKDEAKLVAMKYLERVKIPEQAEKYPGQLSGGQQQRVAIARALVSEPEVILADEPTGALDTRTGVEIMSIFQRLNDEGMSVIIVTHEADVARFANRIIRFQDGRLTSDETLQERASASEMLARMPQGVTTK